MRSRRTPFLRLAMVAGALGSVGALSALGSDPATAAPAYPVGHVYVDDNTPGTNTVSAFTRLANGTLVALPDSPIAVGGAGTGAGTGSQGSLQETPDGRYLLAVDAGSNQISVSRIEPDGDLRPVPGGPVSSDGIDPVSIAVDPVGSFWGRGDLVYVANAGTGGSNYTGFLLGADGVLRPLPGSTVALPAGSSPGDVLFNATGTNLAGTRAGTEQIDSFSVGWSGHLTAAPGSPFAAQGPGPIGSEFRPTNPAQLFVSNAHGGAGNGTVSAFAVSRKGTLTSIGAGPFADNQTAPCWVEITHDGRYLFAVNTAVPSISSYAIAPDGALTLLGSTPLSATDEAGPTDARLSPDGRILYVNDGGSDTVSAFAVQGGTLTPLPSAPTLLPAGASPIGLVVS
jgi:6-phosphogluconolactonase